MHKLKYNFQYYANINSCNMQDSSSVNSHLSKYCQNEAGDITPQPRMIKNKNSLRKSAFYNSKSPELCCDSSKIPKIITKLDSRINTYKKFENCKSNKNNNNILNLKSKKSILNYDSSSISNDFENIYNNNNDYYLDFLKNLYKDEEHLNKKIINKNPNPILKHCFTKNVPRMNLNITNKKINNIKNESHNKKENISERILNHSPRKKRRNTNLFEIEKENKNLLEKINTVKNNISKPKHKKSDSHAILSFKNNNHINKVKIRRNTLNKDTNKTIKNTKTNQEISVKKIKKSKLEEDSSPNSRRSIVSNKKKKSKEKNDKKNIIKNKTAKGYKVKRWLKTVCCFIGNEED